MSFGILLALFGINGRYLRKFVKENKCCPNLNGFQDSCCTFDYNDTFYFSSSVSKFYEQSCCDNLKCSVNLSTCKDCKNYNEECVSSMPTETYYVYEYNQDLKIVPYLPYVSPKKKYNFIRRDSIQMKLENNEFNNTVPVNYNRNLSFSNSKTTINITSVFETKSTLACIKWDLIRYKNESYIRVYTTLNHKYKRISAIQFNYKSDMIFSKDIETPFTNHYLFHDSNTKFISLILKPPFLSYQHTIYIPSEYFSFFQITNAVVADDQFPVNVYDYKCV